MKKKVDTIKDSPKYLASAFDRLVNCRYTIVAIAKYLTTKDISCKRNSSLTFIFIPINTMPTEIAKFANDRAIPINT